MFSIRLSFSSLISGCFIENRITDQVMHWSIRSFKTHLAKQRTGIWQSSIPREGGNFEPFLFGRSD